MSNKRPLVSVVIPSWDGYRKGALPRLLKELEEQTLKDKEVIVIKGVFPQGKSINQGAKKAKGKFLVVMDDDSSLGNRKVLENMIKVLEKDRKAGMVGASITLPPNASRFQRWLISQFPRFSVPVVKKPIPSDMACHGCCAFPMKVFWEIGGEREELIRGLDPDLRHRLREKGYRIYLAPDSPVYHPLPSDIFQLLRLFFRNGKGSAYAQKFFPHLVYETDEKIKEENFVEQRGIFFRLIRFPLRLIHALIYCEFLRFLSYLSYGVGFLWGWVSEKKRT